jgi:surfactin synthase thioesterase subunit
MTNPPSRPPLAVDQWVRRFHPGPPGAPRLVCFPHAGGSASFYFPVSQTLAPVAEVLTLQYPGRQDRRAEKGLESVDELSDHIVEALAPYTDRPLVFFGHSMGAILAYEVARRLERQGVVLRHLFASGRRAPSRHRAESVHTRDDDGIVAELMTLSGTDAAVLGDEEILRMVLPAIRSDYRAIETYRHAGDVRVSCPVTVLAGDDDPRVTLPEAADWSAHTSAGCELRVFRGGHFFLTRHQPEINALIRETLVA